MRKKKWKEITTNVYLKKVTFLLVRYTIFCNCFSFILKNQKVNDKIRGLAAVQDTLNMCWGLRQYWFCKKIVKVSFSIWLRYETQEKDALLHYWIKNHRVSRRPSEYISTTIKSSKGFVNWCQMHNLNIKKVVLFICFIIKVFKNSN